MSARARVDSINGKEGPCVLQQKNVKAGSRFNETIFASHSLAPYLVIPVVFCTNFMGCKELKELPATLQCKSHPAN